ncbi:hypothetical protein [Paenibacillus rigui]|uniref:Uncharacterized protein n=1 Tax=Paenibacillus rigui TaxID=554312 RepID=A0A229UJK3_9BACL|nr:hypothetical protein [Paenibacillus rigui]OXM83576.1 hypothetical protein CF651_25050 [Paenibacillus rigui]
MTTKEQLVVQLRQTITACRADEDLPFWGEVFVLLHELKKVPSSQMPLYELEPVGEVTYDRLKRLFIVRIPDMDIQMKDAELADAIVKKGLFHPKALKAVVPEKGFGQPEAGKSPHFNQEGGPS